LPGRLTLMRDLMNTKSMLRDQRGMTLVELMVAMTMTLVAFGAASYLIIVVVHTQPGISQRSYDIQQGRVLQERFTRDLRASYKVEAAPAPTASTISFDTYVRSTTCGGNPQTNPAVPAIPCQVTYSCTAGACSRAEGPPAVGGGTPVRMVSGLASTAVFATNPTSPPTSPDTPLPTDPDYITVHLEFPSRGGGGAIILDDGVDLRNR
jgi:prepilin-type N-terminal cleavage/methylation domain-containing protein